jgi:hypothetical protein
LRSPSWDTLQQIARKAGNDQVAEILAQRIPPSG